MNFIKYTSEGKIVIQSAALTLSGLGSEKKLNIHTLNHALVLLKDYMDASEKLSVINELLRLANSLATSVATNRKVEQEFQFPYEAIIDAGLDGCDLEVLSDNGIVIIVGDHEPVDISSWTVCELARRGLSLDLLENMLSDIQKEVEDKSEEYYAN